MTLKSVMNKSVTLSVVALVAITVASAASASGTSHATARAASVSVAQLYPAPQANWTASDGDLGNGRFSSLSQINATNVSQLKVAWQESLWPKTGYDSFGAESEPLEVNGVLFMPTPDGVDALNATTGVAEWQYHGAPKLATQALDTLPARTLSMGDGMIFIGQADGSVAAVSQKTGAPVWTAQVASVGTYGAESQGESNPFTVYADGMVYTGINGGDSPLRGHIDAYNATTGALVWRFFTLPDQGEFPFILTWANPAEAATGGAAIWSIPAVDTTLNRLYVGTGNVYPYTGRAPGKDLWANSIVSLDLKTGALKWYYQTTHHDEWDYDCSTPPVLFNATVNGKTVPGVATTCKNGYMYELSRTNGHPIFPIPETPVPNLDNGVGAALNTTWPTQPVPTGGAAQLISHCATPAEIQSFLPSYPNGPNGTPAVGACPFSPADASEYVVWGPSENGGPDFGPDSYDPQTGDDYICAQQTYFASENVSPTSNVLSTIQGTPLSGTAGTVSALNLSTNKMAWQVNYNATNQGKCYGGVLSTAGNVVFTASNGNPGATVPFGGTFYAYNATTGKQLFSYPNNATIEAAPITYMVGGKQYVAIDMTAANTCLSFPGFGCFATATKDKLVVFDLG